ncbi:hypothetical protein O9929_10255 [Vibrio lentus]|nr:hypothetical protein [Vibrio lentus]
MDPKKAAAAAAIARAKRKAKASETNSESAETPEPAVELEAETQQQESVDLKSGRCFAVIARAKAKKAQQVKQAETEEHWSSDRS